MAAHDYLPVEHVLGLLRRVIADEGGPCCAAQPIGVKLNRDRLSYALGRAEALGHVACATLIQSISRLDSLDVPKFAREARRLLQGAETAQQNLPLPIEHKGAQPSRLRKREWIGRSAINAERVYLASWIRANRRRAGVNRGAGLLELLMAPEPQARSKAIGVSQVDGLLQRRPAKLSSRDAEVAATVVQWLGTPVGVGFIYDTERKIRDLERSEDERRARPSLHDLTGETIAPAKRTRTIEDLPD